MLGWMRSTETPGLVPGARIPNNPPPNGEFNGWHFEWARNNTLIEYFENERMKDAALSGAYTREVFGLAEPLDPQGTIIAPDYVWDGGTPHQFYTGYYSGEAPGGWASWQNPDVPDDLLSPETRVDTPGVYSGWHYSLRRFTSYIDITCHVNIDYAYLHSMYPPFEDGQYAFPLNDSIFVFVNGRLAFWSSTDILGSETTKPIRSNFYDVSGSHIYNNPEFVMTDGWYIPIAGPDARGNIAPLLREGKNIIDVITDDFYHGGGMADLSLQIETTEGRFFVR
jgi:hypothetical protein